MDKNMARNTIANAGMSPYDVANSIYLATVEGISGANQNNGYGFALSAIAELWNIRGSVNNPHGRTKLTGRYRGMGVSENMITNVVLQYPDGFSGNTPLFDDVLGVGSGRNAGGSGRPVNTVNQSTGDGDGIAVVGFLIGFLVCKFVLHLGWIASIVLGFVLAGVLSAWAEK